MKMKTKETAPKQVLLSAFGTSDPVRGFRDGPMMRIMRRYRPQVVFVLMSKEITEDDRKDHRLQKALDFMAEHWGYEPQVERFGTDLADVFDQDQVYDVLAAALKRIQTAYPKSEILLNLTSGTPQMQMALMQFAVTITHTLGIQVLNPEKRSGRTMRSNAENYIVDDELELNEDEEEARRGLGIDDRWWRCLNPKMIALQQDLQRRRIEALIDRRDYAALAAMKDVLSPELAGLAEHLAARDHFQDAEARRLAGGLNLPFELYPIKADQRSQHIGESYEAVSEYYLILKNRQITGDHTEFTLQLNPLVIQLQAALLEKFLPQDAGITLDRILCPDDGTGTLRISPERTAVNAPELMAKLNAAMNGGRVREAPLSIYLCNRLLHLLPGVPEKTLDLLDDCERLNTEQRNSAAHSLHTVTAAEIQAACGRTPKELIDDLGTLIHEIYPECDRALFRIYEKCGTYFKENI